MEVKERLCNCLMAKRSLFLKLPKLLYLEILLSTLVYATSTFDSGLRYR